jgi:hypothetical protein
MDTIGNCKIDNIGQLFVLKVTCMKHLNEIYRAVYELWISRISELNIAVRMAFFRHEKTQNIMLCYKKCFPIAHYYETNNNIQVTNYTSKIII